MTENQERPPDRRLLGVALVLLGTITFATGDMVAKVLLETVSAILASWLRSAFAFVATLTLAIWRLGRDAMKTAAPGAQISRGIGVMLSSVAFMWGLSLLGMTESVALNFVSPIMMTALSVPLLRERVGPRRWLAACFGFVGVLVIMRPGTGLFQAAALIPIASAFFWSVSVILTRRMTATERPETTLAWSMTIGLVFISVLAPFDWRALTVGEVALGAVIGLLSAFGHAVSIHAYGRAPPSLLAPFTFAQLLWATLFDIYLLGNMPDRWTLIGAAIIVASGLYTIYRTALRARGG